MCVGACARARVCVCSCFCDIIMFVLIVLVQSSLANISLSRVLQRYAGYVEIYVFTIIFTNNKVLFYLLFLEQSMHFIIFKMF